MVCVTGAEVAAGVEDWIVGGAGVLVAAGVATVLVAGGVGGTGVVVVVVVVVAAGAVVPEQEIWLLELV